MLGIGIIRESRIWGGEQQGGAGSQVIGWIEGRLVWVLNTLHIFLFHIAKRGMA